MYLLSPYGYLLYWAFIDAMDEDGLAFLIVTNEIIQGRDGYVVPGQEAGRRRVNSSCRKKKNEV